MKPEDKAILAHVVLDPEAWYAHAVSHFGQEKADLFLAQKVARHKAKAEHAMSQPGYKTRKEREKE